MATVVIEGAEQFEQPYQALWQFDSSVPLDAVTAQFGDWLRGKGIDVDLGESQVHTVGDSRLAVVHHEAGHGRDMLARLQETNQGGTWITELTVTAPDQGRGWLHLLVTSEAGRYVATPRLTRYLLDSASFIDGGTLALTPEPLVVTERDVEGLAEVLTAIGRQGLVFVAGSSNDLPFDGWARQVQQWTRDTTGLAGVFVLNPAATVALRDIVGPEYATHPWTIRTYRPGLDPAIEDGGRRHRYLTVERLTQSSEQGIRRLLGRVAREHAAQRELPADLTRVRRAISRQESRLGLDELRRTATRPAEPVAPVREPAMAEPSQGTEPSLAAQVEEYARQVELVKRALGIGTISEAALMAVTRASTALPDIDALLSLVQQETSGRLDQIEALEDRANELLRALDEAQIELDIEVEARSKADDEVLWLRRRLTELEDYDTAYGQVPADQSPDYPDSFASLVRRLTEGRLPGVVFTGDVDTTEQLDEHDALDTAVRVAWQACLALSDYVRWRGAGGSGGFDRYLKETPSGYRFFPPGKHAAGESETVARSRKMAPQRLFPVPARVDKRGQRHMFAHIKLGLVGSVSPRMYYFDDVNGTKTVYIGYIGRHLTNTRSN